MSSDEETYTATAERIRREIGSPPGTEVAWHTIESATLYLAVVHDPFLGWGMFTLWEVLWGPSRGQTTLGCMGFTRRGSVAFNRWERKYHATPARMLRWLLNPAVRFSAYFDFTAHDGHELAAAMLLDLAGHQHPRLAAEMQLRALADPDLARRIMSYRSAREPEQGFASGNDTAHLAASTVQPVGASSSSPVPMTRP